MICGLQGGGLLTQLIEMKRHDLKMEQRDVCLTLRSSGTNEEWISILFDLKSQRTGLNLNLKHNILSSWIEILCKRSYKNQFTLEGDSGYMTLEIKKKGVLTVS
jgi:hypothetical protein